MLRCTVFSKRKQPLDILKELTLMLDKNMGPISYGYLHVVNTTKMCQPVCKDFYHFIIIGPVHRIIFGTRLILKCILFSIHNIFILIFLTLTALF